MFNTGGHNVMAEQCFIKASKEVFQKLTQFPEVFLRYLCHVLGRIPQDYRTTALSALFVALWGVLSLRSAVQTQKTD